MRTPLKTGINRLRRKSEPVKETEEMKETPMKKGSLHYSIRYLNQENPPLYSIFDHFSQANSISLIDVEYK